MKKHIKLKVASMALIMGITFLGGCEKIKDNEQEDTVTKTEETVDVVESDILIYNLSADPESLDPVYSTVDDYTIIVNLFEGLTRLNEFDKPEPAVAKEWEVSEDGLTYTFYIREEAKWSDGEPVTAKDFYYAWTRGLNPAVDAVKFDLLFCIKNAEEFYYSKEIDINGEVKIPSIEDVGIKLIDDYTISVTLKYPAEHFLSLCALPIFFPVREDAVYDALSSSWARSLKTFVNNGRYVVTEWNPEINIMLVKNDYHWDKKNTSLKNVDIKIEKDYKVGFNSFNIGIADVQDRVPNEEIEKGLEDGTVIQYDYAGTYFYKFNLNEESINSVDEDVAKVVQDVRVREALALAINKEELYSKIEGSKEEAYRLIPSSILRSNENNNEYNINKAKKLLAEAGFPDGNNFPTLSISINLEYGHEQIAKDIKAMWKENLGINTEIQIAENTVHTSQINKGDYIIAGDSIIVDYTDPLAFLEVWTSENGKHNKIFSSDEYDNYIKRAKEELNHDEREALLKRAEDILVKNFVVLPIYYYSNHKAVKPYVYGMQVSGLGFVYFDKIVVKA